MALFTMLLEYDGGTYISQVRASSPHTAVAKWGVAINVGGVTNKRKDELVKSLTADKPVQISGTNGVWCVTANLGSKLALLNIVQTADEKQVPRLRREARLRSG